MPPPPSPSYFIARSKASGLRPPRKGLVFGFGSFEGPGGVGSPRRRLQLGRLSPLSRQASLLACEGLSGVCLVPTVASKKMMPKQSSKQGESRERGSSPDVLVRPLPAAGRARGHGGRCNSVLSSFRLLFPSCIWIFPSFARFFPPFARFFPPSI